MASCVNTSTVFPISPSTRQTRHMELSVDVFSAYLYVYICLFPCVGITICMFPTWLCLTGCRSTVCEFLREFIRIYYCYESNQWVRFIINRHWIDCESTAVCVNSSHYWQQWASNAGSVGELISDRTQSRQPSTEPDCVFVSEVFMFTCRPLCAWRRLIGEKTLEQ